MQDRAPGGPMGDSPQHPILGSSSFSDLKLSRAPSRHPAEGGETPVSSRRWLACARAPVSSTAKPIGWEDEPGLTGELIYGSSFAANLNAKRARPPATI